MSKMSNLALALAEERRWREMDEDDEHAFILQYTKDRLPKQPQQPKQDEPEHQQPAQ